MNKIKSELNRIYDVTRWVFSIYFKNYPFLVTVFILTELILSVSNLFNAYIIGLATDKAINIAQIGTLNIKEFVPIIALIAGSYFLVQILNVVNDYVWSVIEYQDGLMLRMMHAQRLADLGIQNLEKPEIANKSQRFNEEIGNISRNFSYIITIITGFFTFLSAGAIVFRAMPVVAVVYVFVVSVQFVSNQKFLRQLWVFNRDQTENRRSDNESLGYLTNPAALKELLLSNGRFYLLNKVNNYIDYVVFHIVDIRKRWMNWKIFNKFLDSVAYGYGVVAVLQRLVEKIISVGQLTFEIRTLRIFSDSFNSLSSYIVALRENVVRISDIQELFTKYIPEIDGGKSMGRFESKIELNNLFFKYQNSNKFVLNGLNLNIKSGEKIAIVGENGAGKTTLVKLLCRIYRTSQGEILIDRQNINDLKILSWYKNLSILFQDFNTYSHLTVKDNIEIDNTNEIFDEKTVVESLKKADALNFIKKYKNGIDQILSERYKGGIRPSTGQWQKIAIARVFHRDSPVLILDEPTASIDAVAEAKIFDNIYKFSKGKTVIIISHRFSTVRNADRIIVLDKGKIIEEGSHEELLKNDGKYAKAFRLQAKGYQ